MRYTACGLMAALWAMPLLGQTDPRTDPELTDESVTRRGGELLSNSPTPAEAAMPAEAPRFSPARPHRPDSANGTGRLLPDGSFLVDQPGEVQASPGGAWIFTPDATNHGQVRPMIVLPSQILGRLQRIVGPGYNSASVRLTGRVTLFHDQNYLLLTAIGEQNTPLLPETSDASEVETAADGGRPGPSDGLSTAVESLIDELESERTGVRAVISGIGGGDDAALAPVAEGRMISRRSGRFVRLDAGELAIAFDNDEVETSIDVPLVIAPCALLERVEATLETHGDAMTATVSGQTLAFAGRSFLLPISIVIDRPGELDSRQ